MYNATRVSILFTLLVPLGLVVQASDAPFIIAQLPGQLPGQKPPGQLPGQKPPSQLPGPSSAPAKPATAALPSAGSALPSVPCCGITAINKATGIVTAREKSGGRTIEIKATPEQVKNLRVGQEIFANLETKKASLDGKTLCCGLTFAAATPSLAASAPTLTAAPAAPAGGGSPIGSSSSAAGAAPAPTPSGGKGSGPPTKPTITGKGGNKNTDIPNVDTRTINASEGSTAQAMRGITAASPPTPSAPQSPVKQLVPTKTASAEPIKAGSSPTVPAQQRLPGKAPVGMPQLPDKIATNEGFSLSFDPTTVIGGAKATGTITSSTKPLSSNIAISLSSSDPRVLSVPVEVVIVPQKSSANFAISTKPVATPTVITVSASLAGHTHTATILIAPPAVPAVAAVSLNPAIVIGGSSVTGLVTLAGPAASTGAAVTLVSDKEKSYATVPASIQVAGGSSQATFTVATKSPAAVTTVGISAWTGGQPRYATFLLTPSTLNCDTGQITHNNGMGWGYCDAAPLGTPGNQNTYTVTMATKARMQSGGGPGAAQCLTGIGTVPAGQEPSGEAVQAVQSIRGANVCVSWAYTGNNAGHVHSNSLNSSSGPCLCPTTTDPTWN
jgi:hypothetical protein